MLEVKACSGGALRGPGGVPARRALARPTPRPTAPAPPRRSRSGSLRRCPEFTVRRAGGHPLLQVRHYVVRI
ncbi:hypothetical protein GCM10010327_01970 [Streptomyces nitrosporeus]|nr:hypothetical protein GCM10010327_01970 [Streptomyces nitrosporeus]